MKTLHIFTGVLFAVNTTTTFANESTLGINILEINLPTCNGFSNGSVTVEATGGTQPYAYNWNTFPEQSTPRAINLKRGTYFVQVTDAMGAVFYRSVEISDPIETSINITSSMPEENSTASVSSINNSTEYTYYFNGALLDKPILEGLDIGIHKLEISDNAGCTVIQYIQVYEVEESDTVSSSEIQVTHPQSLENYEETLFKSDITMIWE